MTTRDGRSYAVCRTGCAVAASVTLGITLSSLADNLPRGYTAGPGVDVGSPVNGTLTITAENFASFINWQQFNIGSGYEVRFELSQGDAARILNRVVGNDPSDIHGRLSSNGFVFLVNPAGVTFHSGATLDAAGFYAAAGNISNEDFLNGDFHFTDLQGTVRVMPGALLEAEKVLHLIGKHVINEGMLKAGSNDSPGIVGMFAGNDVLFGEEDGRVYVKIDGTKLDGLGSPGAFSHDPGGGIGVDNQGTVHAAGQEGRVFLGAGDMYSLAIRNSGVIEAPQGEVNIAGKGDVRNVGDVIALDATFGGRDIQLSSDITEVDDLLVFFDPVTIHSNLQLQASEIIANSTIDGLQDGLQNLMLHGDVQFLDGVGAAKRLGALTVDGSLFIGGSKIRTLGQQTYNSVITVGEDATLESASQISFFGPVNADSEGSHGLLIDGGLLINDRIGEDSPLKHLIAKGITTINADWIRTTGDQEYHQTVILATTSELEAIDGDSQVWFWQPLNALPFGDQALTVTGNARFDGQVGGGPGRELAWLEVTGDTAINTSLIRTAAHQTFGGDVTLGEGLVTLDGTDIWFQSLVDAANEGGQGLHILGNAAFDGNVGSNQSLAGLVVDQNATIRGVLIQTTGDQEYGAGMSNIFVLIDGDTILRGLNTDIIFNSTIDDIAEGQSTLVVDGNAHFHDLVGQNVALNSLEVLGTTLIDTSAITTTNLQSYAGAVDLTQNATLSSHIMDFDSTIDGQHELVLNVGDTLRLGGDVGGNTRLVMLEINAGGVTTIEGEQILTHDDILFNPLGTPGVPDIATFAGMNNLLIESLNGSFFMGEHQKLSVLGHLMIDAQSGTATLGDLSTLGNMTVNAPSIFLQSRMPGEVLRSDGSRVTDFGIDFVAGGNINFRSTPQLLRPGFALFASSTGSIDLGGNTDQFFLVSADQITRDMFFFGDIVLDLTALETLSDNLAEVLEGAELELEDRVLPDPLRLILLETLQNMNLNVRDLSGQEYSERLAGRDIYDDSANMVIDDPTQKQVAINRLRRASVITVVDTYIDLFIDADRDPETGELTNVVDRRSQVRETFEAAWDSYRAQTDEPTADGFRDYIVTNAEHEQLATYVTGMEHIFREFSIMGLTRYESETATSAVLEPILPADLGWRDMYIAINGRG